MVNWASRTGSSFVVPNVLRWMDAFQDPTQYDNEGIRGAVLSQIPVARQALRPQLNGLGEPIVRPWTRRFTTPANPDPVWRALAALDMGIYPSEFSYRAHRYAEPQPMTEAQKYELVRQTGPHIRRIVESALPAIDQALAARAAAQKSGDPARIESARIQVEALKDALQNGPKLPPGTLPPGTPRGINGIRAAIRKQITREVEAEN
jgi:hypothetical protein